MKKSKLNLISLTGLVVLLSVFSSCGGGGLSGTYIAGDDKLTFTSGGKVERSAMGITMAGTYQSEGDKVTLSMGGGNIVMTMDKEGCLGGWGNKFCKEKD